MGIGNDAPLYKLDVNGTTRLDGGVVFKTNIWHGSTDGKFRLYFADNYTTYFGTGYGYVWRSNTDTDLMTLTSSGNLGIGLHNPSSRHDINGAISRANEQILYGNVGDSYANIRVIQNISQIAQDGMFINFNSTGGVGAHLRFFANGTTERMRIDAATGNVGIGTTDPGNFKLAVNGHVKAKEVKISVQNWSDFVFDNSYKLPHLNEVETFINQNKHLPNIPSEKEVKENGIDLGEMNAKLLQKIEELTLYIINQNKRVEIIEKELETFKSAYKR